MEITGDLGRSDTRMVEHACAHHQPDCRKRATGSIEGRLGGLEMLGAARPNEPGTAAPAETPQRCSSGGEPIG
jgi:hypothetical protein